MSRGVSDKITYKPYNQGEQWLLPPSLDELVPQNHFVRIVSKTVDELEIMVNGFKICSERLAVFVGNILQSISDLMDDTSLVFSFRKCRIDCFLDSCEFISTDYHNVLYTAVFSSFSTLSQYFELSFSPTDRERTSL